MKGICAAGELLIDFTPCGTSSQGQLLYARNPGGAPANVLAMAARLGVKARLCSVVGSDNFGTFLIESMLAAGIDTRFISRTAQARTTLAFVDLDERNDRSFTFYRKPGADILLADADIPNEALEGCGVYHFSGVSLTDEPARGAVLRAAQRAKKMGLLVSFDPNYRPFLWPEAAQARRAFEEGLQLADIVKLSEEEVAFLLEKENAAQGAAELAKRCGALVLVSCGARGALAANASGLLGRAEALPVAVADTTGAGDAFLGAILAALAGKEKAALASMSEQEAVRLLHLGCTAGSLTASKLGAIPALPDKDEIYEKGIGIIEDS